MSILKIIERVQQQMTGRLCDEADNVRLLLETVEAAGEGDYLEIGVLHGGSLCAVALLKNELGHKGTCYGVDPLNGFYVDHPKHRNTVDPISKVPVALETVNKNIVKFKLDNVKIIQDYSDPLPVYGKFASCYIDGDHWGDMPTRDWLNVCDLVERFVIFDNVDAKHPAVQDAVALALEDERWALHLRQGITVVLRRAR